MSNPRPLKASKKRIKKMLLVVASLIFCLCLAELLLRIVGFSEPNLYEYDKFVGYRFFPNAEGWVSREGKAYIKINNDGLRDREHSKLKPANTIRIAVLGDSYAAALQVPTEDTFWSVMEQALNSCQPFGKANIEVINFGVPGIGTAQEFITLQHYVWSYSPDIVLLAFLTGNDIRNNSKTLEPDKLRPFFVFQDNTLILDNSFLNHPVYKWKTSKLWSFRRRLSRYLRVLQLFDRLKIWYLSRRLSLESQEQGEIGLDSMVFVEPQTPARQEAWRITETLLVKMKKNVEEKNARFVLVSLTNSIQVHPDPKVRKSFMGKLGIDDLFYPDRRIEAFAKKEGIEVLVLAPIFRNYVNLTKESLHGFNNSTLGVGHWNKLGHRLAGESIARYFCEP